MTAKKPTTSVSHRKAVSDGQKTKIRRLAEDAVSKAFKDNQLDGDRIQRLIENGDEFQADILASINRHSIAGEFADEEVESRYGYPYGYQPKPISEQVAILHRLFPILGSADEALSSQPLPDDAEALFAIPRWQKLAPTYAQALQLVIAKLKETGDRFKNWREGALTNRHIRQNERTAARLKLLGEQQEGHDILIVPAQFGLRHRGRPTRRARAVFTPSEFGLGAFAVGCMILTHPEREVELEQLHVDCAGDDYSPDGDGDFDSSLRFYWNDGELHFHYCWLDDAYKRFGSASAFAASSQCL